MNIALVTPTDKGRQVRGGGIGEPLKSRSPGLGPGEHRIAEVWAEEAKWNALQALLGRLIGQQRLYVQQGAVLSGEAPA